MFVHGTVLFCVDSSSLGRLDYSLMPQQALMEIFLQGVTDNTRICGSTDGQRDICDWFGVRCNSNGEVTHISWEGYSLEGSVDLEWIPPRAQSVIVWNNCLIGTACLTKLPQGIRELNLASNKMAGTLNLEMLPDSLNELLLEENRFSGSLNLTSLPPDLISLTADGNLLEGSVDLTHLPRKLTALWIGDNLLEGTTDFSKLPQSLCVFSVENTQLSGTILLEFSNSQFYTDGSHVRKMVKKSST